MCYCELESKSRHTTVQYKRKGEIMQHKNRKQFIPIAIYTNKNVCVYNKCTIVSLL